MKERLREFERVRQNKAKIQSKKKKLIFALECQHFEFFGQAAIAIEKNIDDVTMRMAKTE